eukprot:gene11181-18794_t
MSRTGQERPTGAIVDATEMALVKSTVTHMDPSTYSSARLEPVYRPIGQNDCGMVVWHMTMKTPECPQGRHVLVVANDITFQSGAFSPVEDAVFCAAAELSVKQKLPLVYIAANSGARVGLANEVRERLQVKWVDSSNPNKGFEYLYLSPADYDHLQALAATKGAPVVQATAREVVVEPQQKGVGGEGQNGTEIHWVISDVVGLEEGLGVECAALNKLLGRQVNTSHMQLGGPRITGSNGVYTSHMQLGGPRIMGSNGVSHHVVADDLEGVKTILQLLSFVPPKLGPTTLASMLPSLDPIDRKIGYTPEGADKMDSVFAPEGADKMDVRAAIAGRLPSPAISGTPPPGSQIPTHWQGGLFDAGSWMESQKGWACSVVTGRARLGGLPIGVIAAETETAGQVWYPDSAAKTAAAMEEFNLDGLPLFILANWRGFSGGQRDLFDGILQAGSLIVENLRTYKHPVFVYLPKGAELRGGAWVVVDSAINPAAVELYADPTARGGVLEPEGVVEIKFRAAEISKMIHRLDPLVQQHAMDTGSMGVNQQAIKNREKEVMPIYQQVARQFADMHDTPVRMLAKGALQGIVPWAEARHFFAVRLKRRLAEIGMVTHIQQTDETLTRCEALRKLWSWYAASNKDLSPAGSGAEQPFPNAAGSEMVEEDSAFMDWLGSTQGTSCVAAKLRELRVEAATQHFLQLFSTPEGKEAMALAIEKGG